MAFLAAVSGTASGTTWCYRVALNTALGWHRKEHRRRKRQQPVLAAEELSNTGCESSTTIMQREVVARLYTAIGQIPNPDAGLYAIQFAKE